VAAREPELIILGYGVSDTLQLTVEAQRVISRVGKVYGLNLPPILKRALSAQRVKWVDLADRLGAGRSYVDGYLDIAEFILRRTADERPVVVLMQGNPLYLNAVSRFLLQQCRTRGIAARTLPGVSPFDVIVCELGLDIGTFGLQLFDSRRLVSRTQRINPYVPLLILQPAGFADASVRDGRAPEAGEYEPLVGYLREFYEGDHPITLLNVRDSDMGAARATVTLSRFAELVPHIDSSSSLFLDARQQ
jgi:precorrin-6B methylase 1